MRRRSLLIVIAMMAITLAAAPVSADTGALTPVGDRINILAQTPGTYDADTPFHVDHGWTNVDPELQNPVGMWEFRLEVDGVDQGAGQLLVDGVGEPNGLQRARLFNFEDGLPAGDHTFVGHWLAPCGPLTDFGFYAGPCENRTDVVEFDLSMFGISNELTVTFTS